MLSCSADHYLLSKGAKAAQKRERNADKSGAKGSKSQAKVNESAKSIVCQVCRQPFVSCCCLTSLLFSDMAMAS